MRKILINALGIVDSGGIKVFKKLLNEIKNTSYFYMIYFYSNPRMNAVINEYLKYSNMEFIPLSRKNFIQRLWIENWLFRSIIHHHNISLLYNFSGSAQLFSKIPQLTKIHNLLFYSTQLDQAYHHSQQYLLWTKQIFLKRIILLLMLRNVAYIEVQSSHVQEAVEDFFPSRIKKFFIKSDISITNFSLPKLYDFSKKISFLFIVGPHFEFVHKNFIDFVKTMTLLNKDFDNFEIKITLTQSQVHNSKIWNHDLDKITHFLGYLDNEVQINSLYTDNTILISTSITETLGLHVIEATQNGILAIVPDESYCKHVYGEDMTSYSLYHPESLVQSIKQVISYDCKTIQDIIVKNQQYLYTNEKKKYQYIIDIFSNILKED